MCYCYQKLEIWKFREQIRNGSPLILLRQIKWEGIHSHVICLGQSEAQNREGICSQSPPERRSQKSCDRERIGSGSYVIAKLIDQICHKSLTFLPTIYKNLNMQCNFNMHNLHILSFLFKPNIKDLLRIQILYLDVCTPLYVVKDQHHHQKCFHLWRPNLRDH